MPLNRPTPMHERCDILIIGAGTGPLLLAAAATAMQAGATVVRIAEQASWAALAGFAAQLPRWPAKALQALTLLNTGLRANTHVLEAQGTTQVQSVRLRQGARIAVLGVGYADGIDRRLSNGTGSMMVHGKLVPIIGRVCMDMCMLDVTDVKDVQEGDEVIVFGPELPVQQVAEWAGTIPYEILTGISARVKRVFWQE